MKDPSVEYVQNDLPVVVCRNSQARSQLTVILKEWKQRDDTTIGQIMQDVLDVTNSILMQGLFVYSSCYSGVGILQSGFEMQLEARGDATYDDLVRATDTLMYYASAA